MDEDRVGFFMGLLGVPYPLADAGGGGGSAARRDTVEELDVFVEESYGTGALIRPLPEAPGRRRRRKDDDL